MADQKLSTLETQTQTTPEEEDIDMRKYLAYNWNDMVNILDLKNTYSEMVETKAVSVPRGNRELTVETAKWFIDNGHKFNKRTSEAYNRVFMLASLYLEHYNANRSRKV